MSYFEFPHTRSYDGDLGYIIKRLNELTAKYGEFMEYNSIKFADPIEWNINTVYPAWNIVFANNGYYIAVKPVPAGIMINNSDYWELITPFDVDTVLDTESLNPVANSPVARRFNQVSTSISNVVASLQNEGRQREEADTALDIRVAALEEDTEHLSGALSHETTERETADTALSHDIDAVSARVDNIAQTIVPGGTTGDAELADIRVGANGITYPTAGDAVRGQFTVLQNETEVLTESINEKFDVLNLIERPDSSYNNSRVNPSTGAIEGGFPNWVTYIIPIKTSTTYYISRTSDSISMIWYLDSAKSPVNSLFDVGLTSWNRNFTTPSNGVAYIAVTVTPNYTSSAFIGTDYNDWNTSDKHYSLSDIILQKPVKEFINIGTGTSYGIRDGFTYARNNNIGVIINPGTYTLQPTDADDIGPKIPKHVIGYGAIIVSNLDNENWNFSPLNMDDALYETIVEGVTVEVTNGRYCIHDEMYARPGAYHHVIKNCNLIHHSAATETLLAPRAIGGGIGNAGSVEIYNCYAETGMHYGDISYHSNGNGTQTGNVDIFIHDCFIKHSLQFVNIGTSTDFLNTVYASNNAFGTAIPTNYFEYNMKVIPWNNTLMV